MLLIRTCRKSLPRLQQVCGRQAGRHRLTCLADTIKPFTRFQWQIPKGESQDAGWPDAWGTFASGTGEGE